MAEKTHLPGKSCHAPAGSASALFQRISIALEMPAP
jgi:hypothetical protein